MYETAINLTVQESFRLDLTVWVLRRRAKNIIDTWNGITYRRVLILDNNPSSKSI